MSVPHDTSSPCKGEAGRGSGGLHFSRTRVMTQRARHLRKVMTDVEKKLWWKLRREQLADLNFRRQHPIGPYVLDFYCPSIQLAVELDGGQHNFSSAQNKDERRTAWLNEKGVTVLRFWNNDVMGNMDGVLSEIMRISESLVLRRQTPSLTLPLAGGGNACGSLDSVFGEVDR